MQTDISVLEKRINYTFKNKELILTAMTHSSYYNENKDVRPCNERLEFLGDAVLSIISAEYLFTHEKGDEGDLTTMRANIVCEDALYEYSQKLNLGEFLFLGNSEEEAGRHRKSTTADATEALLGALYLDGGFDAAKTFITPYLVERYLRLKKVHDYKTILQELVQKNKGEKLSYQIVDISGPDHKRVFTCHVFLNSNNIAEGKGESKKAAEQEAAKNALELMGIKL